MDLEDLDDLQWLALAVVEDNVQNSTEYNLGIKTLALIDSLRDFFTEKKY